MQASGFHTPNAQAIRRDRDQWKPLSRSEALRACRLHPVVVMHRDQGPETASWLTPENRFFTSDGPYLYSALRYYQFHGSKFGSDVLTKLATSRPPEQDELEPLEALDMSGAALSLSSPNMRAPMPPKPAVPEIPKVAGPTLPDLPEIPQIPEIPEIPSLPDLPSIPGLPSIPDLALPTLPDLPALPVVALHTGPIPIEIQLQDALGKPLPPTFYRLTLPDRSERTGKSGQDGFIRIPDNTQEGEVDLELLAEEPEPVTAASPAAVATAAAGGSGPATAPIAANHPIEIQLKDGKGEAMPDKAFRIKLPDGKELKGKSDGQGFIRIPDNTVAGDLDLVLSDFEIKEGA